MEDIPQQITSLSANLSANDMESARRQAHGIKGAAANMGANALSAAAYELENAAKNGEREATDALLAELQRQFDLLKEMVRREFE